jgi:NodT family efflux transporter outer membrane factor (OMF) lipoprotein
VARVRQAEAQSKIAASFLFPTLGASAGVSRIGRGNIGSRGVVNYTGAVDASYQVDLFGANRAGAAAAEVRVEVSRYDRGIVALTVLTSVATTYFQILALRDRVRLALDQLRIAESILELVQQQQRIGSISELEVAQQRSAVASQRATIPGLQQTERQSINALAVLVGRLPQGFRLDGRSLERLRVPQIVSGIPSEVLLRRPDLRSAEASLRAANFDVQQARADRFPKIDLTGSLGAASTALGNLFGAGTWLTSLAAGLTAPLFQGGRLEALEENARARYEELTILYAQSILSAFRDVENALSAAGLYGQQYVLTVEALHQASEAYRLSDTRYRTGSVDFLTVLDSQRAMFLASDAVVLANLARFSARVDLYKALGGGWDGVLRS